jgi:hypothetical protein
VTILISGGDTDPSTFEISATGLLLDVTGVQGAIATGGELAVNKSAADVALGSSGVSLGGAAAQSCPAVSAPDMSGKH